ncbi:hypothetical protein JNW88_27265 [Micromonospora sp. ATA32]|nr:hypothetical protein [Micromonospora sp. ATA32]
MALAPMPVTAANGYAAGGDHDAGDQPGAQEGNGTTKGGQGSVAHVVKL